MSGSDELRALVRELLAGQTEVAPGNIDDREPFSSYGLSSVGATAIAGELASRLERDVAPIALFEHSCVAALAEHLTTPTARPLGPAAVPRGGGHVGQPIAIVGMACRVPGATTKEVFWQHLLEGSDAIGAVPQDRWIADDSTGRRRFHRRC